MFAQAVGKRSNRVLNRVDRERVKQFAKAIGDEHPIYVDREYGKKSRYGENIAPPTYPRVFNYGELEGLELPSKGLIHGEQIYHYERPLLIDEEVYCFAKVKDYKERTGSNGKMGILRIENNGEDKEGNSIFTSTIVIIINEVVQKELKA
ncbi:MaoC family dehydratase [Pradoshia sp. D12]|uniref:MaoC family dehydratase N-terminal domain-containing protein n=1 Tax=Bacillaceae TaxID=186817 RepID=UPI00080AE8AC|nr:MULTISPECIES: MaoC family dehydratase N-terminal domain-containing protein [Bacillaceae]OCA89540.1 dehydratase [Bacillus sp. FJAT-27986]QFK71081.1 MaoC family dehydratase [Pradoshia sp. D12]TPF72873.1 MaoC family dehydratase [Bacillus sp. D12]